MLAATQREHINRVLSVADGIQNERDPILRSWSRCVKDYRLDPARSVPAQVIEQARLREHQCQIDEFMKIARTGMERLYAHVVDDGYVVLFTNAQGITVDFVGDLKNADLKRAGLYLAADWGEERAGTCGVGTCIVEKAPISCHQTDHFDSTHLSLTCNSAPLFDPSGDLLGVLDISALTSPAPRESQHLALQMTTLYAGLIEDANFLHVFRERWILRLSSAWSMVEVATEIMFAFDADGVIFGMNTGARRAFRLRRLSFAGDRLADPIGQDIGDLFHEGMNGVWRLANPRTSAGALRTRSGEILFGSVSTPHAASRPAHQASPQLPDVAAFAALAGDDLTMSRLIDQAKRIVDRHVNVLILGETGTGKEVLTRAMHASGARSKQPFVAVNCAAIPEALIESELFGYAPGSFTGGRHKGKSGLILEANGGTLFLDEIGDMPLHLQTRLLRVLSANEVLILGETKPTSIDIRVIAASNQDLQELISKGRFRQDLYYRLCGATLRLPSLRERKDWSFLLDKIFREEAAQANSTARLGPAAADLLKRYAWPGNIRELRNVLRFSLAMNSGRSIEPSDLPEEITGGKDDAVQGAVRGASPGKAGKASNPESQARGAESALLLDALERANWNIPNAASHLGVCRATVYRRMKQNAIVPPNKAS